MCPEQKREKGRERDKGIENIENKSQIVRERERRRDMKRE